MKLLYISPVNWKWIRQRPHFTAELLAGAGHEVCFCSRIPLGKAKQRMFSPCERLTVVEKTVLPLALRVPLIDRINGWFLRRSLLRSRYDAVILTEPRQVLMLPPTEKLSAPIVYDCMDRQAFFHAGRVRERILKLERMLCDRAAAVVVSSEVLKTVLMRDYGVPAEKITVIRNAAAADFSIAPPPEERETPTQGVLYIGTIDEWFDWENVCAFAVGHPDVPVRLVGPVRTRPSSLPDNVELSGPIAHERIPALIRRAKVVLLPFHVNELIEAVDPVKLYEYLACGKNVLASYWKELDAFCPNRHLFFYRDAEEFTRLAEAMLALPEETAPDAEFLRRNNWNVRGVAYLALLDGLAATRRADPKNQPCL